MTIVETSVWVDFFANAPTPQVDWLRQERSMDFIALTDLILMETLQGVRADAQFRSYRETLLGFPVFDTGGPDLALASAEHYRWLRKRGITIRSAIDCLIATFCVQGGHNLLHNDRDFDPFEEHFGLRVLRP